MDRADPPTPLGALSLIDGRTGQSVLGVECAKKKSERERERERERRERERESLGRCYVQYIKDA